LYRPTLANESLSLVNQTAYVSDTAILIYINSEGDTMAVDFSLEGAKWGSPELGTAGGTVTWAVDDSISRTDLQSINAAFAEWSEVANIQFQEVSSTAAADIDFSNSAIDGAGNVLGVTGFSFSGGQLKSADVQFDSGDHLSGSELTLVATHEIGHAIGLDHFNDAAAVMNSTANFSLTGLAQSASTAFWRFMAPTPPTCRMQARGPRRRTPAPPMIPERRLTRRQRRPQMRAMAVPAAVVEPRRLRAMAPPAPV
jgi:matrixin